MDYASALSLQLIKVNAVKDAVNIAPIINDSPSFEKNQVSTVPTTINVGTIPISYNLEVVYIFK